MPNRHNFSKPIVIGSFGSDPVSPENGMMYYNTVSNLFRVYQDGSWIDMITNAGAATSVIVTAPSTNALISVLDGSLDIKTGTKGVRVFDSTNTKSVDQMFYVDKTLVANTVSFQPVADISYDIANYKSIIIEFSIVETVTFESMVGRIYITSHGSSELSISNEFTDTQDFTVLWDADIVLGVVRLKYMNTGLNDLKADFLVKRFPN